MASDPNAPRSRRALLTAAAGGAAAVAASAAMPLTTLAADGDPITIGATDNAGTSETTLTQATDGEVALRVVNDTQGAAALIGAAGDQTNIADDTSFTGVYAFTPTSGDDVFSSTAAWGDSEDIGVLGTGGLAGVIGAGGSGVVGLGDPGGIGVEAWRDVDRCRPRGLRQGPVQPRRQEHDRDRQVEPQDQPGRRHR